AFSLGLIGFSIYLFLLRGFYAQQDTKTPFWVNLGENAINIVLAVALVGAFDVPGLSAAYAVAYLVAAVTAYVLLHRRVGGLPGRVIGTSLLRIGAAAAVMGIVVWLVAGQVGNTTTARGALLRSVVGVVVGAVVYLGALLALRAPELGSLAGLLRRR